MKTIKNKNSEALKSGFWYTICNFLVKSMGFISTPIFTRLLTKAEFGLYNNYVSWLTLITVFVTINLEASLISAKHDFEKNFNEYVFSLVLLTSMLGSIWLIFVNGFNANLTRLTSMSPFYLNSMIIYIIFTAVINLYQAKERYNYGYKKTVFVSTILALVSTLLSIVLVILIEDKFFGRIVGTTIPSIILGVILVACMRTKITSDFVSYWKYAIIICIPYIPHILAGSVLGSIDKIMIQQYWGSEANALYSLAYNCAMIVTMLTISVNAAFGPWLSDKLKEKEFDTVKKVSRVYSASFMYAVIGIMLLAPEILLVLGGSSYIEAKHVIPPVAMGCALQFIYTMYVNVEQIKKKTIGMAIATVIAALINWGLNLLFIPKLGYLAAAYTTLVGYLFLLLTHIYVVKKLHMAFVYDNVFSVILTVIGIIIMSIMSVLYNFALVRYVLLIIYIFIIAFIMFRYKSKIVAILKKGS